MKDLGGSAPKAAPGDKAPSEEDKAAEELQKQLGGGK
jgi:hypothetical protein